MELLTNELKEAIADEGFKVPNYLLKEESEG